MIQTGFWGKQGGINAASQNMQWRAVCLSSSSRMSKSRRGKMRGGDKVTGVTVGVAFLKAISRIVFVFSSFSALDCEES